MFFLLEENVERNVYIDDDLIVVEGHTYDNDLLPDTEFIAFIHDGLWNLSECATGYNVYGDCETLEDLLNEAQIIMLMNGIDDFKQKREENIKKYGRLN